MRVHAGLSSALRAAMPEREKWPALHYKPGRGGWTGGWVNGWVGRWPGFRQGRGSRSLCWSDYVAPVWGRLQSRESAAGKEWLCRE
jgi:hypothetical protein